jgi:hypothetical protein
VRKRTLTIRGEALRGDLDGVTPGRQHTHNHQESILKIPAITAPDTISIGIRLVLAPPRLQNQFNINLNATINACQGLSRQ